MKMRQEQKIEENLKIKTRTSENTGKRVSISLSRWMNKLPIVVVFLPVDVNDAFVEGGWWWVFLTKMKMQSKLVSGEEDGERKNEFADSQVLREEWRTSFIPRTTNVWTEKEREGRKRKQGRDWLSRQTDWLHRETDWRAKLECQVKEVSGVTPDATEVLEQLTLSFSLSRNEFSGKLLGNEREWREGGCAGETNTVQSLPVLFSLTHFLAGGRILSFSLSLFLT